MIVLFIQMNQRYSNLFHLLFFNKIYRELVQEEAIA